MNPIIAKVLTKDKREYYSYVFAMLNNGFDSAIITYDNHLAKFDYINMYKKSPSLIRKVFIIDTDVEGLTSIDELKIGIMSKYKPALGYDWILNKEIINNILEDSDIDKIYKDLAIDFNSKIEELEWRYVKNKKDAKDLLTLAWGFHDSKIDEIKHNRKFNYNDPSSLKVTFTGCWGCDITLLFECDVLMHFSADDDFTNEIFDSSILFDNGYIYWVNEALDDVSKINSDFIFFRARSLKWKFTTRNND